MGFESTAVFRILKRVTEGMYNKNLPPRSAFAAYGIRGFIYVEAYQWSDVAAICRGMRGVRWWETRGVSFLVGMTHLNQRPPVFTPDPGTWVRLLMHPYINDLAFVRSSHGDKQQTLEVVAIPRIEYISETSASKRVKGK